MGDISTIQCALQCKLAAPYSTRPPVYAMWTVVPRYTMYLQLQIFRVQYSTKRICAAMGDISTIQCALYCKLCAKYSAHPPDYAIWTMDPDINNVFSAPHIQSWIFNWRYLRWYWWYNDNLMRVILQTWCQYSAQPPVYAMCTLVPDLYNVITAPHIQSSIFNWTYLRCHWRYIDNSMCVILQAWCQIQRTSSSLRNVNCGPGHIQCIYSAAYSGINIQLNVSAWLLEIYRQFNVRYTAIMLPNTAHILPITIWKLWSRTYTM
jgi:hypothetical protein